MEALRNLGFLLGCYSWQRTVALEAEIAELAPSQYIAFFIRKKKKLGKIRWNFGLRCQISHGMCKRPFQSEFSMRTQR